ncbi:MAG: hypothetical protein R2705_06585 [Ilumatobacteraceae bacterium]
MTWSADGAAGVYQFTVGTGAGDVATTTATTPRGQRHQRAPPVTPRPPCGGDGLDNRPDDSRRRIGRGPPGEG